MNQEEESQIRNCRNFLISELICHDGWKGKSAQKFPCVVAQHFGNNLIQLTELELHAIMIHQNFHKLYYVTDVCIWLKQCFVSSVVYLNRNWHYTYKLSYEISQ